MHSFLNLILHSVSIYKYSLYIFILDTRSAEHKPSNVGKATSKAGAYGGSELGSLLGGAVGPPVIGNIVGNLVGERVGEKVIQETGKTNI